MPEKTKRGANATPYLDDNRNVGHAQALMTMHNRVLSILEAKPETRSSDRLLIEAVYDGYGVVNLPFWQVMESDLPSFETITRCRRKIQQEREDLRAVDVVENERINRQLDFIEYAKGDMA